MTTIRQWSIGPAFDKRSPDPRKNYGVGACILRMAVVGDHGAMAFTMSTGWYPPKVLDDWKQKGYDGAKPMGYGVDYHARKPVREWQSADKPDQQECKLLGGCPCWFDGSALAAEEMLNLLVAEGDEAVWKALEARYVETFGELV